MILLYIFFSEGGGGNFSYNLSRFNDVSCKFRREYDWFSVKFPTIFTIYTRK